MISLTKIYLNLANLFEIVCILKLNFDGDSVCVKEEEFLGEGAKESAELFSFSLSPFLKSTFKFRFLLIEKRCRCDTKSNSVNINNKFADVFCLLTVEIQQFSSKIFRVQYSKLMTWNDVEGTRRDQMRCEMDATSEVGRRSLLCFSPFRVLDQRRVRPAFKLFGAKTREKSSSRLK